MSRDWTDCVPFLPDLQATATAGSCQAPADRCIDVTDPGRWAGRAEWRKYSSSIAAHRASEDRNGTTECLALPSILRFPPPTHDPPRPPRAYGRPRSVDGVLRLSFGPGSPCSGKLQRCSTQARAPSAAHARSTPAPQHPSTPASRYRYFARHRGAFWKATGIHRERLEFRGARSSEAGEGGRRWPGGSGSGCLAPYLRAGEGKARG